MTDNLDAALADLDLMDVDALVGEGPQPLETAPLPGGDMHFFQDVPLTVTLEVASTEVTLGELSSVKEGDVLPLDKLAGEPLDVMVNGLRFAKAEVVMVDGRYGIKFVNQNTNGQESSKSNA